MRLAAGQWARTTKRPLFQKVSREWMDGVLEVEVEAAPLGGGAGEGQWLLPALSPLSSIVPHTSTQQWQVHSVPDSRGRRPWGPDAAQLPTSEPQKFSELEPHSSASTSPKARVLERG
jgi:hypothetical protein